MTDIAWTNYEDILSITLSSSCIAGINSPLVSIYLLPPPLILYTATVLIIGQWWYHRLMMISTQLLTAHEVTNVHLDFKKDACSSGLHKLSHGWLLNYF